MSQQITKETQAALAKDSNKVRPYDKVEIVWAGGFHKAGTITEEHPTLAAKMVEAGKASYNDGSAPATGKKAAGKKEDDK